MYLIQVWGYKIPLYRRVYAPPCYGVTPMKSFCM